MSRLLIAGLLWLFSLILAGAAGWQLGLQQAQHQSVDTMPGIPGHQGGEVAAPPPVSTIDPTAQLDALEQNNQLFAAIDLAQSLSAAAPTDMDLRFRLAALYRGTQQPLAAITELLAIRALSLDSNTLREARLAIDLITEETHQRFETSQAVTQAIRFFEDVLVQEPSYDRHRLYLIRWLIRGENLQTAQRVLDETGLVGVSQLQLDQLQATLNRESSELPVRREGGAMFTDVYVTTEHDVHRLTMLLDTGATLSAISLAKLRAIGARKTAHTVHAQTANGVVELPIYALSELQAGPLTLHNVNVAALNDTLSQADGLLGLDVLDQLPNPLVDLN